MTRRLTNQRKDQPMPRTRSAAKQARGSLRRQANNKSIKSRIHTLHRKFLALVDAKKAAEATTALSELASALDKAAKTKVVHRNMAARTKSRLAARVRALTPAKTA
jgi:small subunit ribosomal protein S20